MRSHTSDKDKQKRMIPRLAIALALLGFASLIDASDHHSLRHLAHDETYGTGRLIKKKAPERRALNHKATNAYQWTSGDVAPSSFDLGVSASSSSCGKAGKGGKGGKGNSRRLSPGCDDESTVADTLELSGSVEVSSTGGSGEDPLELSGSVELSGSGSTGGSGEDLLELSGSFDAGSTGASGDDLLELSGSVSIGSTGGSGEDPDADPLQPSENDDDENTTDTNDKESDDGEISPSNEEEDASLSAGGEVSPSNEEEEELGTAVPVTRVGDEELNLGYFIQTYPPKPRVGNIEEEELTNEDYKVSGNGGL